jgi:hypothetical protein
MLTRHGACGQFWWQSGNRTGHCASCHLNFDTLDAFDRHRKDGECLDPESILDKRGEPVLKSRLGVRGIDCKVVYWRRSGEPMPKFWLEDLREGRS